MSSRASSSAPETPRGSTTAIWLFYLDADGRTALIQALAKPGITLHAMEDELATARRCEALWPCAKSRDTRRLIEEERVHAERR